GFFGSLETFLVDVVTDLGDLFLSFIKNLALALHCFSVALKLLNLLDGLLKLTPHFDSELTLHLWTISILELLFPIVFKLNEAIQKVLSFLVNRVSDLK